MSNKPFTVESLIADWNDGFPEHKISVEDFKKPHGLMAAVFQTFDRLGIDRDAAIAPLSEKDRNENIHSYWDLVPVINTTRIVNHLILVSIHPYSLTNTITQLLQPCISTSQSMLLLLYNLMLFREARTSDLAPFEEELFSKSNEVEKLKDKKNCLIELLNKQTAEKAERAGRIKNIDRESKQYEEELKQENEALKKEKQVLDAKQKECRQMQILQEQKKSVLDALLSEVDKVRSLRVYDAEDIKAQVEQAAQNDQEAEQRLNKLRVTLMEKENCLKNLQAIKPNLDIANNLLYEMTKMFDSLRDYESGDAEITEDELEKLGAECGALEAQCAESGAARVEAAEKCSEAARARQRDRAAALRSLQESEEKERKSAEECEKAAQRVLEIKSSTAQYEKQKMADISELENIEKEFVNMLEAIDEAVLMRVEQAKERMIDCKSPGLNVPGNPIFISFLR